MDRAGPGSGSQTATFVFHAKTSLTTVLHRALGFLRLMLRKKRHETVQNHTRTMTSHGAVGTSTRAVACASKKQATAPSLRGHIPLSPARSKVDRPPVLPPARSKNKNSLRQQCHRLIDRGGDRGESNDLLLDLRHANRRT